jgi:hypothetical protein
MKKFLLEDIMRDADSKISGETRNTKDPVLQTIEVDNKRSKADKTSVMAQPLLPFEIGDVVKEIGDILEKTIILKDNFEKALDSTSINKSQEVAIRKCVSILKQVDNMLLNDLPRCLSMFD